jgi:hypothetical protein
LAKDLFYLASYKNVDKLFEKMEAAKAPEAFTNAFLTDVIGLKSTSDRPLINMLKKMGFLDVSGRPTESYGLLKNKGSVAKAAVADGLRKVYAPLFEANEKVNDLSPEELKGLIAQVTGSDKNIVGQIAYTFNAISKNADFSQQSSKPDGKKTEERGDDKPPIPPLPSSGLRTDFHFNIQVHLPANGTEETYLNIFNALRRTFS